MNGKTGNPLRAQSVAATSSNISGWKVYEDTLNNLVFDPALKPQPELLPAFTDYTLRYMLDLTKRAPAARAST